MHENEKYEIAFAKQCISNLVRNCAEEGHQPHTIYKYSTEW